MKTDTMDNVIVALMIIVISVTLSAGFQALSMINDGRIQTVVTQMIPSVQSAQAGE
jgi:hypothetical protein